MIARFLGMAALALALTLPQARPAAAADKLKVMLDWFVNPDHAALIVAQEKGYFTDAGLDVEFVAPADPNDPPKMVAAGQADLAVDYQPQLQMQAAEGLPLARVATLVSTPLNCVVALADGTVKRLADLKGRKIGFSVAGFEDALLGTMLASDGVALKDVILVNVNYTISPAVISGQVDAVIGAYRNFELNQMALAGHPGRAFYPEEHGVPAYDELVLVAHRSRAAAPEIARFVAAVERATLFLENHPAEAWALFLRHHKDLDDDLNKHAWADTLPRLAGDPAAFDPARYAAFAGYLVKSGVVKSMPPLESYAPRPQ